MALTPGLDQTRFAQLAEFPIKWLVFCSSAHPWHNASRLAGDMITRSGGWLNVLIWYYTQVARRYPGLEPCSVPVVIPEWGHRLSSHLNTPNSITKLGRPPSQTWRGYHLNILIIPSHFDLPISKNSHLNYTGYFRSIYLARSYLWFSMK